MSCDPMIISGRPGSGKTEIVIALCNKHPTTTLLIADEYDENYIRKRGLKPEVKMIHAEETNMLSKFGYETICLDYIELVEKNLLEKIIEKAKAENIRIIAVSQMRRNYQINNPFA